MALGLVLSTFTALGVRLLKVGLMSCSILLSHHSFFLEASKSIFSVAILPTTLIFSCSILEFSATISASAILLPRLVRFLVDLLPCLISPSRPLVYPVRCPGRCIRIPLILTTRLWLFRFANPLIMPSRTAVSSTRPWIFLPLGPSTTHFGILAWRYHL